MQLLLSVQSKKISIDEKKEFLLYLHLLINHDTENTEKNLDIIKAIIPTITRCLFTSPTIKGIEIPR
jgi:hypothetical protein